jgi:hypothetical protein
VVSSIVVRGAGFSPLVRSVVALDMIYDGSCACPFLDLSLSEWFVSAVFPYVLSIHGLA